MELVWKDHLSCCKIAEAQIIKIDCENILGLWKISKLTIGTKKINPKENRHKTPRCTWFDNSLYPRGMTNKFHYNKFGIIQIGVEALSQTQIPNNSLKNTKSKNQRTRGSQIPNTNFKYQLRTNQIESHKSYPKVATHQERANHQTAKSKPSGNKLLSLFQIATHKYQITKWRESDFLTHTLFSLSLSLSIIFRSTVLI